MLTRSLITSMALATVFTVGCARQVEKDTSGLAELQEKARAAEAKLEACDRDKKNLQSQKDEGDRKVAALTEELGKCKGVRIELALDNNVLFASGKATLTDAGKRILDEAAEKIKVAHADRKIVVEGHTDNVAIGKSGWKDNWDLGAARAMSVLRYLKGKHGIDVSKLSASTFADTEPVAGNDTPEGRAKNRRSVIVLYDKWPNQ